jgi:hypothetical protein
MLPRTQVASIASALVNGSLTGRSSVLSRCPAQPSSVLNARLMIVGACLRVGFAFVIGGKAADRRSSRAPAGGRTRTRPSASSTTGGSKKSCCPEIDLLLRERVVRGDDERPLVQPERQPELEFLRCRERRQRERRGKSNAERACRLHARASLCCS